jgi:ubiquitin-protein ligase
MFATGQPIKGRVVLFQDKEFQGSSIMLGLNGSELTSFRKQSSDRTCLYAGKFVFINASETIHTFEDGLSPQGKREYPFEVLVPEWLPSSTIYHSEFCNSLLKIRYGLWAQVIPTNSSDFLDAKKTISIFRGSKEIYLFRAIIPVPVAEYRNQLVCKVGGLMGLGGSTSVTDVVFDRNQYYAGDTCKVRIVCDNMNCSVAIKSFKIKLKRKVFASGELVSQFQDRDDQLIKSSKYLYQFKDEEAKCGPKSKVEKYLEFKLPEEDYDLPSELPDGKEMNETEKALLRNIQATTNGHLFQVQYTVKIFVKHDAMTQFGEGECLTFPIKILEKPPLGFDPTTKSVSHVGDLDSIAQSGCLVDDASKKYFNTYIKNFESQWLKGQLPYQTSAEQEKAEEKEIQESVANFEQDKQTSKKRQNERLEADLQEYQTRGVPGTSLVLVLEAPKRWKVKVEGPRGTGYEGQEIFLTLYFNQDYPAAAPRVMIDDEHNFEMEILDNWNPEFTARQILAAFMWKLSPAPQSTSVSMANHNMMGVM